jgi:hypothetical protein
MQEFIACPYIICGCDGNHPADHEGPVPKQKPVGWIEKNGDLIWNSKEAAIGRNLYTHPQPKREWVDLTLGEFNDCLVAGDPCEALAEPEAWAVMQEVQAKLKEKNHG